MFKGVLILVGYYSLGSVFAVREENSSLFLSNYALSGII